jgi:hypothetical protein
MRIIMKIFLIAAVLLADVSAFSAQISIGIRIGPPPPPRVVRVLPYRPRPDYVWVDGYWYPAGHNYKWHKGHWTRPPYPGAVWIVPHYDGSMYFSGFWSEPPGRFKHGHGRDHERELDGHEFRARNQDR